MKKYKSTAEAAKDISVSPGVVSAACRNIHKTAGGCHWSYVNELTEEKVEYAKQHQAKALRHFIYCVNTQTMYSSADKIRFEVGDWQVVQYIKGERGRAGKSGYDYKFLYDYTKKDGTIIPGAISLGLITEEEAFAQLNQL
jgi:hypothetical protein